MSVSYCYPSTSNACVLALDNDYTVVSDNVIHNPFQNNGVFGPSSSLFTYDDTTGQITIANPGKYLLVAQFNFVTTGGVLNGGYTLHYGTSQNNSYYSNGPIHSTTSDEFARQVTFIITVTGNTDNKVFFSIQSNTNPQLKIVAGDYKPTCPSFLQLLYLGA